MIIVVMAGTTGDSDIAEDIVILPMPVIPVQPVTATLILGEAENLVDIVPCVRRTYRIHCTIRLTFEFSGEEKKYCFFEVHWNDLLGIYCPFNGGNKIIKLAVDF